MAFPKCEYFEICPGTIDGFCNKGGKKTQILKADRRPCPNHCDESPGLKTEAPEKAKRGRKKKKPAAEIGAGD